MQPKTNLGLQLCLCLKCEGAEDLSVIQAMVGMPVLAATQRIASSLNGGIQFGLIFFLKK